MKKNKWIWLVIFILIFGLTVYTIVSQSSSFDGNVLLNDLKDSNKIWLIAAVIAMFANIFFESRAIRIIIKTICPEYTGKGRYLLYSSADNYFSAITPFTSGGQPAVVYFMLKDKISVAGTTTALILDYIACTLTKLFEFLVGVIVIPTFVGEFSTLSIILIIIGGVSLTILNIGLLLLLTKPKAFKKIATGLFNFLNKIFHFKNLETRMEKLNKTIEDYEKCSIIMKNNKLMVFRVVLNSFIQKLGRSLATVFVFFAVIKSYDDWFTVWFIQVASDLGASLVPIPGGMGAREYILIDGFSRLSIIENAANLGLVCEAISFYLSILVSGLIVLFSVIKKKKKKVYNK